MTTLPMGLITPRVIPLFKIYLVVLVILYLMVAALGLLLIMAGPDWLSMPREQSVFNGLLIVEGQTERDFFITASKIAQPGARLFHLRATADGGQASPPVLIRVLPSRK